MLIGNLLQNSESAGGLSGNSFPIFSDESSVKSKGAVTPIVTPPSFTIFSDQQPTSMSNEVVN